MSLFVFSILVYTYVSLIIVAAQNNSLTSNNPRILTSLSRNESNFENISVSNIKRINYTHYTNFSIENVESDNTHINIEKDDGIIPKISVFPSEKPVPFSVPFDAEFSPILQNQKKHENIYRVPVKIKTILTRNTSSENRNQNFPFDYGILFKLADDIGELQKYVEKMENSLCKTQSLMLIEGLLTRKSWALKMYDSSAKLPKGLLSRSTFQLGNFDECLGSTAEVGNDSSIINLEAQYCLARVETRIIRSGRTGPSDVIHWAMCVPSSCLGNQVQEFASSFFTTQTSGIKITVEPTLCHTNKPQTIHNGEILFLSLLGGYIVFLILSTFYHFYTLIKYKNSQNRSVGLRDSIILSFSLWRNFQFIFSTDEQNKLGLEGLSGLRFISMTTVLFFNTSMFLLLGPVMNYKFTDYIMARIDFALMLSGYLFIDALLIMNAFFMCKHFLYTLEKQGHVNLIQHYILRYIRVSFPYFVVIAFYVTWLDKLNTGPLWDSKMAIEKNRCLESWWTNILFINNFVNTNKLCMFQSWQLSVDMQLYFLAPALVYPLWKWPPVGKYILGGVTLVTAIIPFVVTYLNNLDATFLFYPRETNDISSNFYLKEVFIKTYMRANGYCVGLVYGYILYRIQKTGYKFSKFKVILYWTLSSLGIITSIFSVNIFYQPYYVYDSLIAAIYSAVHRIVWSLSFGWILIAVTTKNAGLIGTIISWKFFIPLRRLTYCAYLVNGIIGLHGYGTLRKPTYVNYINLMVSNGTHIFYIYLLAVVWSIAFESPILSLKKRFTKL